MPFTTPRRASPPKTPRGAPAPHVAAVSSARSRRASSGIRSESLASPPVSAARWLRFAQRRDSQLQTGTPTRAAAAASSSSSSTLRAAPLMSPFKVHNEDVEALATLTEAEAALDGRTVQRMPEKTSDEFRARVERELAEQREATALRRQEHAALSEHTMAIRRMVSSLSDAAEKDVAGEAERQVIAANLFEAEAARAAAAGGSAKLPSLPRRVGYSSAAVVDIAAEAKIEQLHQVIANMAAEQQRLRTRLAASEFENGEKSERVSELEATVLALRAQIEGITGCRCVNADDTEAEDATTAPPSRRGSRS